MHLLVVPCTEVILVTEGPLSEVLLYTANDVISIDSYTLYLLLGHLVYCSTVRCRDSSHCNGG